MQKPQDYDSAQALTAGRFDNPAAGWYVLGIVKAEEIKVKNGDRAGEPMLALELDIAVGPHANHYRKLSEKLGKPLYLRHNRVISQANYLKGDIQAIEKSNPGFIFNFDEKTLVRKLVGAALREEEYLHAQTQEVKSNIKIAFLCSKEDIGKGLPVPKKKVIDMSKEHTRQPGEDDNFEPPQDNLPW